LVLDDVLDGKVSIEAARSDYGVVIEGREFNREATAHVRAEALNVRGPITWRFDRGPLGRE